MNHLLENEVFGLVKTNIDVHTLGITTLSHLLRDCGYGCFISSAEISIAVEQVQKLNNFSLLQKWILEHHITRIGFSYRLDPQEACDYFCRLFYELQTHNLEVPGSSPGWSTLRIKHLQRFCRCFFFYW